MPSYYQVIGSVKAQGEPCRRFVCAVSLCPNRRSVGMEAYQHEFCRARLDGQYSGAARIRQKVYRPNERIYSYFPSLQYLAAIVPP